LINKLIYTKLKKTTNIKEGFFKYYIKLFLSSYYHDYDLPSGIVAIEFKEENYLVSLPYEKT